MPKKVIAQIRLQIPAGKASPAPPVGPALGQHGVNIMKFVQEFNAKTANMGDDIIPVIITVYEDRSFDFVTKVPPASYLIKKAAGLEKGAGETGRQRVGKITRKQLEEIAKRKMPDLNTKDLEAAMRIIEGTARSMGVEIVEG